MSESCVIVVLSLFVQTSKELSQSPTCEIVARFPWNNGKFFLLRALRTFLMSQHTCEARRQKLLGKRNSSDIQRTWWSVNQKNNFHTSCFSYFPCFWSVSHTDHHTELIQSSTKVLRNKRTFKKFSIQKSYIRFSLLNSFNINSP